MKHCLEMYFLELIGLQKLAVGLTLDHLFRETPL